MLKAAQLLVRIIDFCSRCAADGDVGQCKDKSCPLWDHRKGPNSKKNQDTTSLIKAISSRCLQCSGYEEMRQVYLCKTDTCPLWQNRMGTKTDDEILSFMTDDEPDWLSED